MKWKQLQGAVQRCAGGMRRRASRAWRGVRKRMTRQRAMRLGWYASLAALLVLLGAASYGYRNRDAKSVQEAMEVPREVMAQKTPAPEWIPAPSPEPERYVWPVEGEIVGDYTPEELVWSQTMGQWQSHAGLDIAAGAGEAVVACADGTVSDAWRDRLWGNVIVIEHPGGLQSTYAGLNTLELVKMGDAVKAGQVISSVGNTAICEADLPFHLHFALERDGKPVNFAELLAS